MFVLFGMSGYVVAAEAVEALEADEQSLGVGLNDGRLTGSLKHRTHWSL